mgnify:FL=1
MMNLGGPATPAEVAPFLIRMFSDKSFIPIPFNLGPKIARLRAKSVSKQYEAIGGSPLSKWTDIQGSKMVELLDQMSPETAPHKFYPCFRYSSPLTEEACQEVVKDNVERLVAFTQYPQYSCSTTGNSLRELNEHKPDMKISAISRWSYHPAFINAWVSMINEKLKEFEDPSKVNLVFTAHSIPAYVAWRGDRYPYEIGATVSNIMNHFNNPHYLFWQSKVGFQQWLEPPTDKGLFKLGERGEKDVLLIPVAFIQDHLETLFELDLEYVVQANEKGMNVKRCPAPNDHPEFINALAQVVKEHLHEGKHSYIPRCVNCALPDKCSLLQSFSIK